MVWHTLDLRQPDQVRNALATIAPDIVIHAAAIGDIDFCECILMSHARVNVGLTAAVAECCVRRHCRLIYLSTDTVFDGLRGDYVESDPPSPLSEYARTKAAGESIVSQAATDAVVAGRPGDGFRTLGKREFVS